MSGVSRREKETGKAMCVRVCVRAHTHTMIITHQKEKKNLLHRIAFATITMIYLPPLTAQCSSHPYTGLPGHQLIIAARTGLETVMKPAGPRLEAGESKFTSVEKVAFGILYRKRCFHFFFFIFLFSCS